MELKEIERKVFKGFKIKDERECQSFILEDSLPWMQIEMNEDKGRLICAGCPVKVGRWIWSGTQCSCGAWVCPAIQLQSSRIKQEINRGSVCYKCIDCNTETF